MSLPRHALCLNCEEMIPFSDTSTHSYSCCYVLPEVLFGSLQNTKAMLAKFDRFLETVQGGVVETGLKEIQKVSKGLLRVARPEEAKKAVEELEAVEEMNASSPFFLVTLQRLKKLSKDLLFHMTHSQVAHRKAEIERMKLEIELYKHKTQFYREQLTSSDKFSTVIQGIDSRGVSPENSLNVSVEEGEQPAANIEQITDDVAAESLKKYFYVKCIAIKLGFKPSHKAHKVSIESLYNEALRKEVPIETWPNFIKSQLEHAEQHLRKGSMTRFEPKSVIPEETD